MPKTIQEIVRDLPRIKQGSSQINAHTYFEKIIQSHGLTASDEDIISFLQKLTNDPDFFSDDNMPKSTQRAKITGMVSLRYILDVHEVKEKINNDALVNEAIATIDKMRKYYQTEYKQSRRLINPTPTAIQKADEDVSAGEAEAGANADTEPHQIILDNEDESASVMITDDDIVSRRKIDMRVKHAIDMLEKYMRHEDDEFKKAFLEVIRDNVSMISKDV